jgi:hypothetical protein
MYQILTFFVFEFQGISGLLGPHSGAEATFGSEFKSNHDDIDSDDDAVIDWNVQLEKMNRSLQHHERTVQVLLYRQCDFFLSQRFSLISLCSEYLERVR